MTFLFTDIEGSTRLLNELGADGYDTALAAHRRAIRQACAAHGGVEVDTQGDAFLVAFDDASAAIAAADAAQQALAGGPISVRMGLHTGNPRVTGEGYVGHDVHLGARIAAAGHGGQVLVSRETRELAGSHFHLTDLGEHRVKDFAQPVWLFQLGNERFPPLRTISNTNLPRPASSFVGRQREVNEIGRLIRDGARLVTLTGPGGTGKTRLAIESAADLVAEYRNGVFWVDLAPVRQAEHVADTISHTIGATVDLAEHIGGRQMMLVLDNLEQVLDAAPELAALLATSPNLSMLITSREPLRVNGEVDYPVEPLNLHDAADLFAKRAGLDADDDIKRLCERLDNLPLAVELAAARTSVLSPRQILERLATRLDLLRGGRDADPRQQTLRATIEWSHDLLSSDERRLFARMAVFAGGCRVEDAEAVCDADLDVLQSLVDKSLIRFSDERFAMLETIRDFATERLYDSGELDRMRRRHAEHFLALAEQAEPHVLGGDPTDWLNRLELDHANIRTALDWLAAAGESQLALRLGGALWEFWCLRAHYTEGARRLIELLASDSEPTPARAKALLGACHLSYNPPEQQVEAWATEAIGLFEAHNDEVGGALAEYEYATIFTDRGDFATAATLVERSIPRLRSSVSEHRALGAMRTLAWCYEELGDKDRQKALTAEILTRARQIQDRIMEARALAVLSGIASDEGRHDEALKLVMETVRLDQLLGDPDEINTDLARLARVLALSGLGRDAVALISLREATRPDPESDDPKWVLRMQQEALSAARAQLSQAEFDAAWIEGRQMSIEDAVQLGARRSNAGVPTTLQT